MQGYRNVRFGLRIQPVKPKLSAISENAVYAGPLHASQTLLSAIAKDKGRRRIVGL
jgi:hypothetical protein